MTTILFVLGGAILALIYGLFTIRSIIKLGRGIEKMISIAKSIQE
jgi:uncharacterized membrane protein YciS (DUF1049 family)